MPVSCTPRFLVLALLVVAFAGAALAAPIQFTQKITGYGWLSPGDTTFYPESNGAEFLWRTRASEAFTPSSDTHAEVAVEESDRWASSPTVGQTFLSVHPSTAPPYRVASLKWLTADESYDYETVEVDRANVSWSHGGTTVRVGRQAVGLGRGVLFSALDVLAPFSPLDVDREWRPGIDAATATVDISKNAAAGAIIAGGRSWDDLAALATVSGYRKGIDGLLVAGKHAQDAMLGAAFSAPVGGAEVHAEWATFRLPVAGGDEPRPYGSTVNKDVLGASTMLHGEKNLYLLGEYLYSGFGARTPGEMNTLIADAGFQRRLLRGDTQIFGREGTAFQASETLDEARTASLTWVANPRDGSGAVVPALVWNLSDTRSVLLSATLPYGRTPIGGTLRSEYGSSPTSVTVQMTVYQ